MLASTVPGWAQDEAATGANLFNGTGEVAGSVAIGATNLNQPVSRFACRSCHQRDGLGGSEAKAPAIAWEALNTPTPARPAYDAETFRAALAGGIRAGGGTLDTTMPRFSLADAAVESLIAYLTALPEIQKRGIGPRSVTFGVVVPHDNERPARAYASLLQEALNGQPDIFGRQIRIVALQGAREALIREVEESVAAILGLIPSKEIAVADFENEGVPVLFPLSLLKGDEDQTLVRGMIASQAEQVSALYDRAKSDGFQTVGVACFPECQMQGQETTAVSGAGALDGLDALVIAGTESEQALKLLERVPDRMPVYAIAGELPDLVAAAEKRAGPLTLSDGYETLGSDGNGLLERHARKTAHLLREALISGGRQLTRNKLIAGFDRKSLPEFGLDYGRYPLTGTASVRFLHTPAK